MDKKIILRELYWRASTSRGIAKEGGEGEIEKAICRVSRIMERLKKKGMVSVKERVGRKGHGWANLYELTERGKVYAELLIEGKWYCEECGGYVQEEKRPTCKKCGSVVSRQIP